MPKETFSVFISPKNGGLTYLHKEAIKLEKYGHKEVTRASEVEFDDSKQEWYAALNDGTIIARDKSRDQVLLQERAVIESMLSSGTPIPGCSAA